MFVKLKKDFGYGTNYLVFYAEKPKSFWESCGLLKLNRNTNRFLMFNNPNPKFEVTSDYSSMTIGNISNDNNSTEVNFSNG